MLCVAGSVLANHGAGRDHGHGHGRLLGVSLGTFFALRFISNGPATGFRRNLGERAKMRLGVAARLNEPVSRKSPTLCRWLVSLKLSADRRPTFIGRINLY